MHEIKHEKAKEVGASLTLQKLVKSICLHVFQLFKDFEEWEIVIVRPLLHAFNGLAFTGFKDETELHNITFKLNAYENKNATR